MLYEITRTGSNHSLIRFIFPSLRLRLPGFEKNFIPFPTAAQPLPPTQTMQSRSPLQLKQVIRSVVCQSLREHGKDKQDYCLRPFPVTVTKTLHTRNFPLFEFVIRVEYSDIRDPGKTLTTEKTTKFAKIPNLAATELLHEFIDQVGFGEKLLKKAYLFISDAPNMSATFTEVVHVSV